MSWLFDQISRICASISTYFYMLGNEASMNWYIPDFMGTLFYGIDGFFGTLMDIFDSVSIYLNVWETQIAAIITEWDIWTILSTPIQWASTAFTWVQGASWNVWSIVSDWWLTQVSTVQGWINIASNTWNSLLNNVRDIANNTWAELTNFFAVTLPTLVGWGELESIVISKLREWFPWYNTLCYFIDDIETFFSDPLGWLYNKIDDFFERFWEGD